MSKNNKENNINTVANKLIILLNLKSVSDKNKILIFVKTLFFYSKDDIETLKEKFEALFESIENYTDVEDVFKKKLRKVNNYIYLY